MWPEESQRVGRSSMNDQIACRMVCSMRFLYGHNNSRLNQRTIYVPSVELSKFPTEICDIKKGGRGVGCLVLSKEQRDASGCRLVASHVLTPTLCISAKINGRHNKTCIQNRFNQITGICRFTPIERYD